MKNRQLKRVKMNKTALAYRELGAKRFRETFGLCYEDFEIGDVFEHRPGRTITDEQRPGNTVTDVDNILLTLLTMNIQPVFLDEAYATNREWKKRLIDSTLTIALLTAMSVRTVAPMSSPTLGGTKSRRHIRSSSGTHSMPNPRCYRSASQ
jgi:itaconyl-CoA hydratase